MTKKIFFLAGEQSGDMHGALVIKRLKEIDPTIEISGVGGVQMQAAGMNCIYSCDELAVIGFLEVIKNIGRLLSIEKGIKGWLKHEKPDMVILIDYPGFNKRIAKIAKSLGIHVLYYITPQVWAWNSGRVKGFTEIIDEAVVVFPFEVDIWSKAGCKTNYFGHPLISVCKPTATRDELLKELNITGNPIISLMPGSRKQEIGYILPELVETAKIIKKEMPEAYFLLPAANAITDELIKETVDLSSLPIKIVRNRTYDVVGASDLCIVASGTATLETAIIGTPLMIVYQANWLTRQLSKYIIESENIGMPNVIAGKRIVPEFIRETFYAPYMASEAIEILTNENRRKQIKSDLMSVKAQLGEPGADERVAEYVFKQLQELNNA